MYGWNSKYIYFKFVNFRGFNVVACLVASNSWVFQKALFLNFDLFAVVPIAEFSVRFDRVGFR